MWFLLGMVGLGARAISEKLTQVLETLQKESAETRRELTRAVDALTELVKRFIGQQHSTP